MAGLATIVETDLSGYDLLNNPLLNKATAFTEEERGDFELHGLLPPSVATLDEQVGRRLQALRQLPDDFARYVFLRGLQDTNEVLFYALLVRDLAARSAVRCHVLRARIPRRLHGIDRLAKFTECRQLFNRASTSVKRRTFSIAITPSRAKRPHAYVE